MKSVPRPSGLEPFAGKSDLSAGAYSSLDQLRRWVPHKRCNPRSRMKPPRSAVAVSVGREQAKRSSGIEHRFVFIAGTALRLFAAYRPVKGWKPIRLATLP